jgi:hypothetical protein
VTCASAHSSVHGESGEGGTDKAGPRRRERKGDAGGNGLALANRAREAQRERGSARVKKTGADRLAPLGSEREREGARERGTAADRRGPPVRRHGRATWLGLVGRLGCFLLFFSLDLLIPFLFLFL